MSFGIFTQGGSNSDLKLDRAQYTENKLKGPDFFVAAVHDGEGGTAAVSIACSNLNYLLGIYNSRLPDNDDGPKLIKDFFVNTVEGLFALNAEDNSSVVSVVAVCSTREVCVGWMGDCEAGVFEFPCDRAKNDCVVTGASLRVQDYEDRIPWYAPAETKTKIMGCEYADDAPKSYITDIPRNFPLHTFFRCAMQEQTKLRMKSALMGNMYHNGSLDGVKNITAGTQNGKITFAEIKYGENKTVSMQSVEQVNFCNGTDADREKTVLDQYAFDKSTNQKGGALKFNIDAYSNENNLHITNVKLSGSRIDATRAMGDTGSQYVLRRHTTMRIPLEDKAEGTRFMVLCSKGASRAFGGVGHIGRFCVDPLGYLRTSFYKKNGRWDVDLFNILGSDKHRDSVAQLQSIQLWNDFLSFLKNQHIQNINYVCDQTKETKHLEACIKSIDKLQEHIEPERWTNKNKTEIAGHLAVLMGCTDDVTILIRDVHGRVERIRTGLAIAHVDRAKMKNVTGDFNFWGPQSFPLYNEVFSATPCLWGGSRSIT